MRGVGVGAAGGGNEQGRVRVCGGQGDRARVRGGGGRTGPKSAGDAMRTQNTHLKNVLVSIMY